jgi:hypothetical protein
MIGIDDPRALVRDELDVVVLAGPLRILRLDIVKEAPQFPALDLETPRHAEMDEQDLVTIEMREDVFCATRELLNAPPR